MFSTRIYASNRDICGRGGRGCPWGVNSFHLRNTVSGDGLQPRPIFPPFPSKKSAEIESAPVLSTLLGSNRAQRVRPIVLVPYDTRHMCGCSIQAQVWTVWSKNVGRGGGYCLATQNASKMTRSSRLDVVGVTSLGRGGRFPSTCFVFDLLAAPFRPKRLKMENTSNTTHLLGSKGAVVAIRGRKGPWEASRLVFQPRHMVLLDPAAQFYPIRLIGISPLLRFSPRFSRFWSSLWSHLAVPKWP